MRGWSHWRKFTREDNAEAGRLFAQAAKLDPESPRVYRGLAWFHAHEFEHRWSDDPERSLELSFENARKAVSLAPSYYGSYWTLGVAYLYRREFDQALFAYERAYELNPNDANLLASSAESLIYVGRAKEAIDHIKRAARLNPFHPDWYTYYLGWAYYDDQRYEDAVRTLKPLGYLDWRDVHLRLAASYARLGQLEEAKVQASRLLKLDPEFSIETYSDFRRYKHQADLEHFLDGLRIAGLPE
jgi:tetratricopeptide (TPR) repeat protein